MDFALAQPQALGSVGAAVFVLLAAGVTAMTAFVFIGWFGVMLVRGMIAIVTYLPLVRRPRPEVPPAAAAGPALFACPDPVCRSINPREASFCRQCGRMFKRPEQA